MSFHQHSADSWQEIHVELSYTLLNSNGSSQGFGRCIVQQNRCMTIFLALSFIQIYLYLSSANLREARPSLVGGPVFKTGGGDEKSPWWVRFPCASAKQCKVLY